MFLFLYLCIFVLLFRIDYIFSSVGKLLSVKLNIANRRSLGKAVNLIALLLLLGLLYFKFNTVLNNMNPEVFIGKMVICVINNILF